jgi:hypothetical protein
MARGAPDSLDAMSTPSRSRPADRYGDAKYRRTALAPGLLGAIALLAGLALIDVDAFTIIRFAAAILAAIVAVFAVQARHWWWVPPLAAIVVVWNPIYPLDLHGAWWVAGQYVAALVFVAAGVLIRVPLTDEDRRR